MSVFDGPNSDQPSGEKSQREIQLEVQNARLRRQLEESVRANGEKDSRIITLEARLARIEDELSSQRDDFEDKYAVLLEQLAQAIEQRSIDKLTGAQNRHGFEEIIRQRHAEYEQGIGRPGAIIVIDIDRFKDTNTDHGHDGGDDVLVAVAQRLREIRFIDAGMVGDVIRLGGDEFAIVVEDLRSEEDRREDQDSTSLPNRIIKERKKDDRRGKSLKDFLPAQLREKLDQAFASEITVRTRGGKLADVGVTISEGVAFYESPSEIKRALREADEEAYVRKSGLDSFLEWHNRLSLEDAEFVDELLGLYWNPDLRGGCEIDRDISVSVRLMDRSEEYARFFELTKEERNPMDSRGLSWVFGDQREMRNQSGQDLHLLS